MKTTFLPSRRWIGWGGLLLLMLVMVSCNQEEPATSRPKPTGPWELVLKYEKADLQGDDKTELSLLLPEDQDANLDSSKPVEFPERDVPSDYRLTEYKAGDDLYYYILEYRLEHLNDPVRSYFKAVHTSKGWRFKYAFDRPAFERETEGLEGEMEIREIQRGRYQP